MCNAMIDLFPFILLQFDLIQEKKNVFSFFFFKKRSIKHLVEHEKFDNDKRFFPERKCSNKNN